MGKNIMENHSNRIKQQQTLLLEIENMTSTLERSQSRIGRVIPNPNSNPFFNPTNSDQNSSLSHQLILEDPLTHPRLTHQPEVIKIEPVNIAPSPVPTGDQMVPYLKQ